MIYGGHFDIVSKEEELKQLEEKTYSPNFWDDRNKAEEILKNVNELKNLINSIQNTKRGVEENKELLELIDPQDNEFAQLEKAIIKEQEEVDKLNLLLLLNGPYDKKDCILEIHSGAGGTEPV